ncbi:MAG: RsmB/NOP family class I SAM-dependent RNA methyltransferase [Maritimibacter sp.]
MTPAARIATAIEILDLWRAGTPAEQALTSWARKNRFAGSKDRAAIRDHVFEAIRCARSFSALGGGETGRAMMIGALRDAGTPVAEMFNGAGYGPAALSAAEEGAGEAPEGAEALDCPEWLAGELNAALGDDFAPVMRALRHRAPVFVRVNLARMSREDARASLAAEGIAAQDHGLSPSALEITEGARRVAGSQTYLNGLVELQDAASQAVVDAIPFEPGARVLDYCAGGGGKSLALAARGAQVWAHDIAPNRMKDLPERAARAGVQINTLFPDTLQSGPKTYDIVFADAPCSGSGSWRRAPQGKWDLTAARLDELPELQASILSDISRLVAPGGVLAYATCSLLARENTAQIQAFLARHSGWKLEREQAFTPLDGGDGFYIAILTNLQEK